MTAQPAAPPQVQIQGVQVIARLLNLTVRHVQRLARDGVLPTVGRGRYPLVACVHAYIKYWQDRAAGRGFEAEAGSLDAARTRKTVVETQLAEIQLAEAQGRLIPIEQFKSELTRCCEALSARVRGLGQYIGDVQLAKTDAEAADLLDRITDELLRALRSTADDDDEWDDEPGDDGPASRSGAKAVVHGANNLETDRWA